MVWLVPPDLVLMSKLTEAVETRTFTRQRIGSHTEGRDAAETSHLQLMMQVADFLKISVCEGVFRQRQHLCARSLILRKTPAESNV